MTDSVHESVGPVGEEAAKLLAAAQEWFHRAVGDPATARIATGSAECAWCPLCQLIAVMRGERAGAANAVVVDRFSEVQGALAGLLRALADGLGSAGGSASTAGASDGGASDRGASGGAADQVSRVQRIDLDAEPGEGS
jgi:hypothetical protein